jgi:hypothetical protein
MCNDRKSCGACVGYATCSLVGAYWDQRNRTALNDPEGCAALTGIVGCGDCPLDCSGRPGCIKGA